MIKFVCSACGGNDLVKQGDFFVCQYCGVKYTPDDVHKMIIEGTVDVQGTVKIDNSSLIEKCLQNARNAKMRGDWTEAEKYYSMVVENDPANSEAVFYSSYAKARETLFNSSMLKMKEAFNTLVRSVFSLDNCFDEANKTDTQRFFSLVSNDILKLCESDPLRYCNGTLSSQMRKKHELFENLNNEFCNLLEKVADRVNEKEEKLFCYELVLKHSEFYDTASIARCISKILQIDPSNEFVHKANKVKNKKTKQLITQRIIRLIPYIMLALAICLLMCGYVMHNGFLWYLSLPLLAVVVVIIIARKIISL